MTLILMAVAAIGGYVVGTRPGAGVVAKLKSFLPK